MLTLTKAELIERFNKYTADAEGEEIAYAYSALHGKNTDYLLGSETEPESFMVAEACQPPVNISFQATLDSIRENLFICPRDTFLTIVEKTFEVTCARDDVIHDGLESIVRILPAPGYRGGLGEFSLQLTNSQLGDLGSLIVKLAELRAAGMYEDVFKAPVRRPDAPSSKWDYRPNSLGVLVEQVAKSLGIECYEVQTAENVLKQKGFSLASQGGSVFYVRDEEMIATKSDNRWSPPRTLDDKVAYFRDGEVVETGQLREILALIPETAEMETTPRP